MWLIGRLAPDFKTIADFRRNMDNQARKEIGAEALTVVADRGYYKGLELLACEQAGIMGVSLTAMCKGNPIMDRR
ncbi:hypothetical protein BLX42_09790 [Pseudomonas sp. SG-MS2]|nr:hypothetical protein BLX42_09790 [Pseudomonas sp. SG-MS2]